MGKVGGLVKKSFTQYIVSSFRSCLVLFKNPKLVNSYINFHISWKSLNHRMAGLLNLKFIFEITNFPFQENITLTKQALYVMAKGLLHYVLKCFLTILAWILGLLSLNEIDGQKVMISV